MQNIGKPRALVRKREQSDKQACGDANMESGGMAPKEGGQQQAGAQEGGNAGRKEGDTPAQMRLTEASAEVLTALRTAKEELAKELEANLKQLKSVLEETQRIQKQMEAVLKETQCAPSLKEQAHGKEEAPRQAPSQQGQPSAGQQASDQKQQQVPPWEQLQLHPGDPPPWKPPDLTNPQSDGTPPPWKPPPQASQPPAQQP